MTTSGGIIARVHISEKKLKEFLQAPLDKEMKVIDFWIENMYTFGLQQSKRELLIQYDALMERLLYWHFQEKYDFDKREQTVFELIAKYKDVKNVDYAIACTDLGGLDNFTDTRSIIEITSGRVNVIHDSKLKSKVIDEVSDNLLREYQSLSALVRYSATESLKTWRAKTFGNSRYFYVQLKQYYELYESKKNLDEKIKGIRQSNRTKPYELSGKLFTDGKHVYEAYASFYFEKADVVYQDADPFTFEMISRDMYVDKQYVYHKSNAVQQPIKGVKNKFAFIIKGLEHVKIESIKILGNDFWEDTESVFYRGKKLQNVSASRYILNGLFLLSDDTLYIGDKKIQIVNPKSIDILSNHYCLCDGRILDNKGKVISTEGSAFQVLKTSENEYYPMGKDSKHVFFGSRILKGVSAKGFKRLNAFYATDGSNIFFNGQIIKDVDAGSVKVLGENFLADKENVFYQNHRIKCDRKTFKVTGLSSGEDKEGKYYNGKKAGRAHEKKGGI